MYLWIIVFSESILLVYIIPKPVSSDVLSFPITFIYLILLILYPDLSSLSTRSINH